jgi:hypothetical protein
MSGEGILGGLTASDDPRRMDIALHVMGVLRARALTPADQVMILMMAAGSVIASNACTHEERAAAVQFAGNALGSGVVGAARALDRWMEQVPVEGRA